jgi:hypothetical protein
VAHFEDAGEIPVSMDELWAFLRAHLDDARVPAIHKDILSQRTLSSDGSVTTVERVIRFGRRKVRSVWKLTYAPPTAYRWDILEGDGPMATGSYLENTYSPAGGGVRVVSRGEVTVVRFPSFLQGWIVRSAFRHIDREDLAALGRPR